MGPHPIPGESGVWVQLPERHSELHHRRNRGSSCRWLRHAAGVPAGKGRAAARGFSTIRGRRRTTRPGPCERRRPTSQPEPAATRRSHPPRAVVRTGSVRPVRRIDRLRPARRPGVQPARVLLARGRTQVRWPRRAVRRKRIPAVLVGRPARDDPEQPGGRNADVGPAIRRVVAPHAVVDLVAAARRNQGPPAALSRIQPVKRVRPRAHRRPAAATVDRHQHRVVRVRRRSADLDRFRRQRPTGFGRVCSARH